MVRLKFIRPQKIKMKRQSSKLTKNCKLSTMAGTNTPVSALIQDLASSRIDSFHPDKRKKLINDVTDCLKELADDRDTLAKLKGKCFPYARME